MTPTTLPTARRLARLVAPGMLVLALLAGCDGAEQATEDPPGPGDLSPAPASASPGH